MSPLQLDSLVLTADRCAGFARATLSATSKAIGVLKEQSLVHVLLLVFFMSQASALAVHEPAAAGTASSTVARNVPEGPLVSATVDVGPFDLHRKYKSMEGPYIRQQIKVGDLLASGRVALPESMIKFVERSAADNSNILPDKQPAFLTRPAGLVDTSGRKRELYWLKGATVEVLDEHGRSMPSAEFFCHMVVFVDKRFRNHEVFSQAEPAGNERLLFLSQGLSEFFFPKGFAVPIATDENWVLSFQAANRTSDKHRRIKHRLTLYFVKDSTATASIKALNWYMPYVAVLQDKKEAMACSTKNRNLDCMAASSGACAPNSVPASTVYDSLGRKHAGHWVVPPGTHTYKMPLDLQPGLANFAAQDRKIHAVWCHVHPLCVTTSVVDITGTVPKKVFTVKVKTDCGKGLEIKHIDNIISQTGIPILKGHRYQVEATYVNDSSSPQDAMINHGVFCADLKFQRPKWADDKR